MSNSNVDGVDTATGGWAAAMNQPTATAAT